MGCDIHGFLEVKIKDQWYAFTKIPDDRDYDMFGVLADVRNYANVEPISQPRGVPEDASVITKFEVERYGSDGHSHSYLTVDDIKTYDWTKPSMDTRPTVIDIATNKPLYKASYTIEMDRPNPAHRIENLAITPKMIREDNRNWDWFFDSIEEKERYFGKGNIRFIFWFDN